MAFWDPVAATENALSTYSGCYMNYSAISLSLVIFCFNSIFSARVVKWNSDTF